MITRLKSCFVTPLAIFAILVLSAAGLPNQVIAAAIPLIMSVDWILARVRSGVNVMSDMLVAILLDELESKEASDGPASIAAKSSML